MACLQLRQADLAGVLVDHHILCRPDPAALVWPVRPDRDVVQRGQDGRSGFGAVVTAHGLRPLYLGPWDE